MSRLTLALSLAVSTFVLLPSLRAQQASPTSSVVVPRLIRFGGVVRGPSGNPLNGVVGVTFALYKDQEGGGALWLETQNVALDASGRYSLLLGATKEEGVPMDLFTSGEAHWLGVRVEGQVEQPRILLVSVPYALKAADAATLGGLPPSAFALAAPAVTSRAVSDISIPPTSSVVPASGTPVTATGGKANQLAVFDAAADIKSSQVFDNGTNVAIGSTAPAAKLDVSGGGIFRGVLQLPATGTASATSTAGFPSQPLELFASDWNSSTKAAVSQHFRWQATQLNSNTASPSATLNLLFASGTGTPAQTGFKVSNKGIITFAPGQTLPTVMGNEAVTGNISAKQLISTVATGTPPLSVASTTQVPNLNASLVGGLLPAAFAQVAAPNLFLANQAVRGDPGSGGSAGTINEILGNVGCGGGETGQGSAGIDFTGLEDCAHYSFLGDGANTFLNRPTGGKLHFREGNADEVVVLSGGDVGVGTNSPSGRLGIVGGNGPSGTGARGEFALVATGGNGDPSPPVASAGGDGVTGLGGGGKSGMQPGADGIGGVFTGGSAAGFSGGSFGDGLLAVAGSGNAADFKGDIAVSGAVIAGRKDFEIDHPLDPANRYRPRLSRIVRDDDYLHREHQHRCAGRGHCSVAGLV